MYNFEIVGTFNFVQEGPLFIFYLKYIDDVITNQSSYEFIFEMTIPRTLRQMLVETNIV